MRSTGYNDQQGRQRQELLREWEGVHAMDPGVTGKTLDFIQVSFLKSYDGGFLCLVLHSKYLVFQANHDVGYWIQTENFSLC